MSAFSILNYGVMGLGFLLAYLAYKLLGEEQKREIPRKSILVTIHTFMMFSIILCVLGLVSEYLNKKSPEVAVTDSSKSEGKGQTIAHNTDEEGELRKVRGSIKKATVGPNKITIQCEGSVDNLRPEGQRLWMAVQVNGRIWFKEGEFFYNLARTNWIVSVKEEGTANSVSLLLYVATLKADEEIRESLKKGGQVEKGNNDDVAPIPGVYRLNRLDNLRVGS